MPKTSQALPKPGDAFAFKLENGMYGACRVLHSTKAKKRKDDCVLAACSDWIGEALPDIENDDLRGILCLNHHKWADKPEVNWIGSPVPDSFIHIGTIPPTEEEQIRESNTYAGWHSFPIQRLSQWRWDHEQEAVLTEDEIKDAKQRKLARERETEQQRNLNALTLQKMQGHAFLASWTNDLPIAATKASRIILEQTLENLTALGRDAEDEVKLQELHDCIVAFNTLDSQHEFIDSLARDEIIEEFEYLQYACGLGHLVELADRWRDW